MLQACAGQRGKGQDLGEAGFTPPSSRTAEAILSGVVLRIPGGFRRGAPGGKRESTRTLAASTRDLRCCRGVVEKGWVGGFVKAGTGCEELRRRGALIFIACAGGFGRTHDAARPRAAREAAEATIWSRLCWVCRAGGPGGGEGASRRPGVLSPGLDPALPSLLHTRRIPRAAPRLGAAGVKAAASRAPPPFASLTSLVVLCRAQADRGDHRRVAWNERPRDRGTEGCRGTEGPRNEGRGTRAIEPRVPDATFPLRVVRRAPCGPCSIAASVWMLASGHAAPPPRFVVRYSDPSAWQPAQCHNYGDVIVFLGNMFVTHIGLDHV